jgi:hypothetical protein
MYVPNKFALADYDNQFYLICRDDDTPDAVPVDYSVEPNKYTIPVTIATLAPFPPITAPPVTWPHYITTLPPWEQTLLKDMTFVDIRQLFTSLRSADTLLLASDGGASDRRGSFRALIATGDTILIECGGRAQGANPPSFRAEGYGILAVLRLLFHIRYFYVLQNRQARFRLYCDSESLLKRIDVSRKLKRSIPQRYIFSEVNVEMQILAAIQAMAAAVTLEHAEGHQDTKYPGQPFPWEAQLNQRRDEIATVHLEVTLVPLPTVPFVPASQVSLSLGYHTITHHIPTQLRTFTGLPGLRTHFAQHHDWETPAIFDLVDWPLFHAATLAIKWINSLLPFQQQQYRYKQSEPLRKLPVGLWLPHRGLDALSLVSTRPTQTILDDLRVLSARYNGEMEP